MIKLYKRNDDTIFYHEAWIDDDTIIEHWGAVGDTGDQQEHSVDPKLDEDKNLLNILQNPIENGFNTINDEDHIILLIEYEIDSFGTSDDLDKLEELENRMNQTLGWTGLGHCDGNSIGSGTMEVCCYVVDFTIAKRVITEDLKNTRFEDYLRIYNESEEDPTLNWKK